MSDLSEYHWKNRLILLFSSEPTNPLCQHQHNLLRADQSGLDERDLLIFRVLPNRVANGKESVRMDSVRTDSDGSTLANNLRKRYRVDDKEFLIILIGKDGSEKLRSDTVVSPDKLYALIDAMPMRREETRKKN